MENFEVYISRDTPVLVDLITDSREPFDMFSQVLKHVRENLGRRIEILQIDAEKEIAGKYDVQSVPTMILFQNGTMKWRILCTFECRNCYGCTN